MHLVQRFCSSPNYFRRLESRGVSSLTSENLGFWTKQCNLKSNIDKHVKGRRSGPALAASSTEEAVISERLADEEYMQEYQKLKDDIVLVTRNSGGILAVYFLATIDGEAALCALAGSAASIAYLLWMFRDVDSLKAGDRVALTEANKVEDGRLRFIARVFAAWSHALNLRLVVPVSVGALTWALNQWAIANQDGPALDTFHQFCVLAGFLCYKVPLLLRVFDDNVPKVYQTNKPSRPVINRLEDNLDMWGRPKKNMLRMPTDALPEDVDRSELNLENPEEDKAVTEAILTAISRSATSALPFGGRKK